MMPSDPENFSVPSGIKATVRQAVDLIAFHPSVDRIESIAQAQPDCVHVTVAIRLGLPLPWMAEGSSPNGVWAVEPVVFSFPPDFPVHAPKIRLRDGFDRSLAHIQPGSPEEPIYPCVYEGNLDELLQAEGLWSIINQTVNWLEKAALGQLIDPEQGWEPVRRDNLKHLVVIDSDRIRSLVSPKREKHFCFPFVYVKFKRAALVDDLVQPRLIYGQVGKAPVLVDRVNIDQLFYETSLIQPEIGYSLAIVVTPGKLPSGTPHIAEQYQPETVADLNSLRQRAKEYGCLNSLDTVLSNLKQHIRKWTFKGRRFPIAVILCARRPFHLIGESSEIEILPYILDIGAPQLLTEGDRTPVTPAAHQHAITPKLLKSFSGESPLPENRDITLIGGGSLGSKIALHLTRSGKAPKIIVDKGLLTSHNAARYALIPSTDVELTWFNYKADALALAIAGFGQSSQPFHEDVTQIVQKPSLLKQFFPDQTWGVINATASLAVRETLASIQPNILPQRIIETSLYANGLIGLVTVEGNARNPNSSDLIAQAYEAIRVEERLRKAFFEADEPMRRQSVGHGCGSMTMAISDAKLSLMAASMTMSISQIQTSGFSDEGRILLGAIADDGMGLNWTTISVSPSQIVPIQNNPTWNIRIAARAHQKILEECSNYSGVETGGLLVGRVSQIQQAFIVTDVLPASQDSQRSRSEFVLGTVEVKAMLENYSESCGYALYCLGTWHSHLQDSDFSKRDWQTAQRIAQSRIITSVLLIRTPVGYHAITT